MNEIKGYILRTYNSVRVGENDSINIYAALEVNEPITPSLNGRCWKIPGSGYWERKVDEKDYNGCLKDIDIPMPDEINKPIPVLIDLEEKTCEEVTPDNPLYNEMMKGLELPKKEEPLKPGHYWMVVDDNGRTFLSNAGPKPVKRGVWVYDGDYIEDYWIRAEEQFPDAAFPIRDKDDEPIQVQIIGNKVTWYRK